MKINPYDLNDVGRVRWWHIKYGIRPSLDELLKRHEESQRTEQTDRLSTKGIE